MRYPIYLLVLLIACGGCAASYRVINPLRIAYRDSSASSGGVLEYRYDVLREAGNKKYSRKANDKKIKIVAIKFTNHTDLPINLSQDVEFLADRKPIIPLSSDVVKREVKQISGLYMLWSLFWVTLSKCENDDCSITPIPVGLLIGIGNTAGASGANRNFHKEVEFHNVINKIVDPGETKKGLLILRVDAEQKLELRLR